MTDQELIGLARQALNMARTAHVNEGHNGVFLATYFEGEGIHRMERIEQTLARILGEDWLNHGQAKDIGFGVLRKATDNFPETPHAIIIVTASNMFKPTEKMKALPLKEQERMINTHHGEHHKLAAQGYLEIIDSMTALVQTPERACIATQEVCGPFLVGDPETKLVNQSEFGGRLKMFGEDPFAKEAKKRSVQ